MPQVVEDSGVWRFISRPIDSLLRQARFVPLLAEVLPVLVLVDEWIQLEIVSLAIRDLRELAFPPRGDVIGPVVVKYLRCLIG